MLARWNTGEPARVDAAPWGRRRPSGSPRHGTGGSAPGLLASSLAQALVEGEAATSVRERTVAVAGRPVSGCLLPARNADVAQLVEQLIRNQQVSGSNPLVGSMKNPASTGVS